MTNIYDKINDIDFEVDSVKLNDIERVKMKKTAKSYAKKDTKKKFIASAAAVLLFAGLMTPSVRAEVQKFTTDIKVSMMDAFGASPDSYKYVTELNKPVSVGDDSFVIENIAFEDDRVFINTLREGDGSIESMLPEDGADIYKIVINGETYKSDGRSGSTGYLEDGKTMSEVTMMHFDKDFPSLKEADVDLYYVSSTGSNIISIKADTNTVNEENVIFAKDMPLDNGAVVSLIKLNPITMTGLIKNLDQDYFYDLIGVDNNGNTIYLNERTSDNGESTFIYNNEMSELTLDQIKNAGEITFTLKKAKMNEESGKLTDGKYETVAEFSYKAE
ncbi:hypothetical protein [uncultured Anaerococcus sp.]|uniref:hypothetical protein n=1 Tax=uncultured Anaerococcus sp. TaxID=293428 RepID=UPI0025D35481|nr:hypothetical protein [uncultured Anaerococcus sp.]